MLLPSVIFLFLKNNSPICFFSNPQFFAGDPVIAIFLLYFRLVKILPVPLSGR